MQSDFYKNTSSPKSWFFAHIFSILLCIIALIAHPANAASGTESMQQRMVKAAQVRQLTDLGLTKDEQAWLQTHPVIRVGIRHGYAPIEYISEGNQFRGITIDYLYKLEALLGITFKMIDNQDYSDLDSIDMLSGVTNPKALKKTSIYCTRSTLFNVSLCHLYP